MSCNLVQAHNSGYHVPHYHHYDNHHHRGPMGPPGRVEDRGCRYKLGNTVTLTTTEKLLTFKTVVFNDKLSTSETVVKMTKGGKYLVSVNLNFSEVLDAKLSVLVNGTVVETVETHNKLLSLFSILKLDKSDSVQFSVSGDDGKSILNTSSFSLQLLA